MWSLDRVLHPSISTGFNAMCKCSPRVYTHQWLFVQGCQCMSVSEGVCFPCGSKSPCWHVGSVRKQQVRDMLMAFTDGCRTLPTGGLLLHLLIYSFSTAQHTLRPMWLFPKDKVPWEQLVFLSNTFFQYLHSFLWLLSLSPPLFLSPFALLSPNLCVHASVCVFCRSNLITPV